MLIGGQSWLSPAGKVNSALALRLPGSPLKPFTYALAFSTLGLTPNSRLLDIPTQFLTKEGYSYAPKNYSQSFAGEVSAAEALAQSLNVPAVRLLGDL